MFGIAARAKRRKCVGGTFGYHDTVAHLQVGPQNVTEFAMMPYTLMERCFTQDPAIRAPKLARLSALLEYGLALHTDCTGRMTPEIMFNIAQTVWAQLGVRIVKNCFLNYRGCDILNVSQKIMKNVGALSPKHIWPNIFSYFPEKHAKKLQKMMKMDENAAKPSS